VTRVGSDADTWVQEAADHVNENECALEKQMHEYVVICRYSEEANVMEYQVIQRTPSLN